jgi:lysozyme
LDAARRLLFAGGVERAKDMKLKVCLLFAALGLAAAGCGNSTEVGTAKAGWNVPSPVDYPDGAAPTPTPTNGPIARGIDVSEFQGTINWATVASHKQFAIIRVSYGSGYVDPKWATNWSGAKNAGILRGAYQFFRPSQDATAQANLMLSKIGTYDRADIPPTLDVEVTEGYSDATIVAKIKEWVNVVRPAIGREPMIYTSPGFWGPLGYGASQTTLWVAHWGVTHPLVPGSWSDYTFWQYSDSGSVAGISGAVDPDEFHGDKADLDDFLANGP